MEKSNGKSLRHFKSNGQKCSPIAVRFAAALSNGRDVSFAKSARKTLRRGIAKKKTAAHTAWSHLYISSRPAAGRGPSYIYVIYIYIITYSISSVCCVIYTSIIFYYNLHSVKVHWQDVLSSIVPLQSITSLPKASNRHLFMWSMCCVVVTPIDMLPSKDCTGFHAQYAGMALRFSGEAQGGIARMSPGLPCRRCQKSALFFFCFGRLNPTCPITPPKVHSVP